MTVTPLSTFYRYAIVLFGPFLFLGCGGIESKRKKKLENFEVTEIAKEMGEKEKVQKMKRSTVESLGWLTESSIMPKKVKAIEGVGASSIMELKAQLYRSQEESKKSRDLAGPDVEYQRAKRIIAAGDHFSRKNSGVESRSHKDKLAFKAEKDGTASYAALEKKAELYEKLMRGEISDEEDEEKYCVDFFRKGLLQDELQKEHSTTIEPSQKEEEEADPLPPFHEKPFSLGRTAGNADHNEHKRFVRRVLKLNIILYIIMEVHEEASEAREKASELKLRRQGQALARREKLKQAYLKKRLQNLKGTSKAEQT
ncbi:hypothetical protein V2J09_000008 [Rumex salicifolius]